jgi:predicted exporter
MRRDTGRLPIIVWLLALTACLVVVWNSTFTADMSAFLPQRPSASQQLLVEQLREGSLSRLLLIGIEGGDDSARVQVSKALAAHLRASGEFSAVQNGDAAALARDRELLFANRYLLSPAVDAWRFGADGLRQAFGDSIDLLASPAGLMIKQILPQDPTGELVALLSTLDPGGGPASAHGVWVSRDGRRAMLMAQTAAAGSDTDAQERALGTLRTAFAEARIAAGNADMRLLFSGTPAFSVDTRATIRDEVERLAILGALGIVIVLLVAYRSLAVLGLSLLPVLSGALAGVAAVSLGFGSVHGITIGFGTTLIGEAVDYSIYYFVQSGAGSDDDWRARFWPTIRLGVLTSLCGFASMLFSGFPGLAQLGLYSMSGLLAAAAVTRFVLPRLRPANLQILDRGELGRWLAVLGARLGRLRWAVLPLVLVAIVALVIERDRLWSTRLGELSPLPAAALALNESLRADVGAPDQQYLLAVGGDTREAALQAAERVAARLPALVDQGIIAGFETPTRFLPSEATQRARQMALPNRDQLIANLHMALNGLPLRPEKLTPFIDDVAAAATQPLLTREALAGSSLALAVDAMLLAGPSGWTALLPLQTPSAGEQADAIDPAPIAALLAEAGVRNALFVDLGAESNRLYADYLNEAILLSLAGFVAIVILLAVSLRSAGRVVRVLAPLVAAVLLVMAGLVMAGERLTLLHLVGLLLNVAVGSNYALFFDGAQQEDPAGVPRTLTSLVIANATTVIGFGILAFAKVPVLHAIGVTVGPGAVLALLLSATLAGRKAA